MTELIPRLQQLAEANNGFNVPEKFVYQFVALHADDWRMSQSDWELVVARVLDTDAVEREATGRKAMCQAVAASYRLLEQFMSKGVCPLCQKRRGSL
jgi:hypothetical protein